MQRKCSKYKGEFCETVILGELEKPSELSADLVGIIKCADVLLVFRAPSSYRGVMDGRHQIHM